MILANLAKAIREQNYYAVVLEFLIVIAGVVIGFQITAWNAAREAARNEQQILSRLQSDFMVIHDSQIEKIEQFTGYLDQATIFLDQAGEGALPNDINALFEMLDQMRSTARPISGSPTYSQLLATGEMSLIQSEDLISALAEFESYRQFHAHSSIVSYQSNIGLSKAFWDVVGATETAVRTDNETLENWVLGQLDDPEFIAATLNIRNQFRVHLGAEQEVFETVEKVRAVLDGENNP